MVEMPYREFPTMPRRKAVQQAHKHHGIHAAGDAHKRSDVIRQQLPFADDFIHTLHECVHGLSIGRQ